MHFFSYNTSSNQVFLIHFALLIQKRAIMTTSKENIVSYFKGWRFWHRRPGWFTNSITRSFNEILAGLICLWSFFRSSLRFEIIIEINNDTIRFYNFSVFLFFSRITRQTFVNFSLRLSFNVNLALDILIIFPSFKFV